MPRIQVETEINAPVERVFDLSRNIDLHRDTQTHHQEKSIAGRTSGLITMNERVTWEARHLGLLLRLTSRITAFERPLYFRDSMVEGIFRRFDHDHIFEEKGNKTLMIDIFDYTAPFGILGHIADLLFLENYIKKLLHERSGMIREIAESHRWKNYLKE